MKKVVALLVCVLSLSTANGQDFEKGGNYVTAGFGFNPYGRIATVATGSKYTSLGPALLGYEKGITDILGIGRIGVGGTVGFSTSRYTYTSDYYDLNTFTYHPYEVKHSYTSILLMAKAAYHFEFDVPKMDVYAGVGVGGNISISKSTTTHPDGTTGISSSDVSAYRPGLFAHHVFAGIRYYFTDSFGVYAEVGHGHSALNGGIVFSF